MSNHPKVSIIVACFNVENYIEQCVTSLTNQSYKNIEIILVNDESTDATYQKLIAFKQKDDRIIIINQKNKGLSQVRNEGIKLASGTFIMFVDGDDWLDLDCLQIIVEKNLTSDVVCFSYYRAYENSVKRRFLNLNGLYNTEQIQRRIVGLTGKELSDPSQADSLVTACIKLYKTNIIKTNNIVFIDTKDIGTEDALFNINVMAYANSVYIIDEPLYFYRRYNTNSLTSTYKPRLFVQWKNLYAMIFELIKNKEKSFYKAYQNRICLSTIGLGLNETNSKNSLVIKYKNLKHILNDKLYVDSFTNFDLSELPLHWKLFFFFAKHKVILPLILMLEVIKKIISR